MICSLWAADVRAADRVDALRDHVDLVRHRRELRRDGEGLLLRVPEASIAEGGALLHGGQLLALLLPGRRMCALPRQHIVDRVGERAVSGVEVAHQAERPLEERDGTPRRDGWAGRRRALRA